MGHREILSTILGRWGIEQQKKINLSMILLIIVWVNSIGKCALVVEKKPFSKFKLNLSLQEAVLAFFEGPVL